MSGKCISIGVSSSGSIAWSSTVGFLDQLHVLTWASASGARSRLGDELRLPDMQNRALSLYIAFWPSLAAREQWVCALHGALAVIIPVSRCRARFW